MSCAPPTRLPRPGPFAGHAGVSPACSYELGSPGSGSVECKCQCIQSSFVCVRAERDCGADKIVSPRFNLERLAHLAVTVTANAGLCAPPSLGGLCSQTVTHAHCCTALSIPEAGAGALGTRTRLEQIPVRDGRNPASAGDWAGGWIGTQVSTSCLTYVDHDHDHTSSSCWYRIDIHVFRYLPPICIYCRCKRRLT